MEERHTGTRTHAIRAKVWVASQVTHAKRRDSEILVGDCPQLIQRRSETPIHIYSRIGVSRFYMRHIPQHILIHYHILQFCLYGWVEGCTT